MQPVTQPSSRRHSRQAILEAAAQEFGARGMEGARTSTIARKAGVNQALLYYYFDDKDSLYCSVFEEAMASRYRFLSGILAGNLPPGEKVLRFALGHFDFLAHHPDYPRLVVETAFGTRKDSQMLREIIARYVRPLSRQLDAEVKKGIRSGEFRRVDPGQFTASVTALTVFYFVSVPVYRMVRGVNPLSSGALGARRRATLDTVAAALFTEREHGLRLAARLLQEQPMPFSHSDRQAHGNLNRRPTS